ncbi:hypothetical protein [Acinetobacter lwoffii]|uniref:hypothetical protein n=1 Tax=Acinetobacter lwoffii TaxID=28090 RepID=UPI0002CF64C4|nr:hypothetical protein [Acinetobacter lwoffii]ENW29416.1 hypothetical protein F924_00981 [Acinetobacter lwoffii ATCC 9957 = CIP 70.31]
MKANEYIKKYGLVCANIKVAETEHTRSFDVFYFNLKRLVESHELVEKWQGLEASKIKVNLLHTFGFHTQADQLQQAITDVESCMEVSSGSN